jgi:hypothetical protein
MIRILIFTILFCFNAYSETCQMHQVDLSQNFSSLLVNDQGLISAIRIKNSPCKSTELPTEKRMLKFIQKKQKDKKSITLHGAILKDSPELIKALQDMTTAISEFGPRRDKQINLQGEYSINPDCEDVVCTVKKIWGNAGLKMLYTKMKYQVNTSQLFMKYYSLEGIMEFQLWDEDELNDVILTLQDLPHSLYPLRGEQLPILRIKEGIQKDKTVGNAIISFYPLYGKLNSSQRQMHTMHELAHAISDGLGELDVSQEWKDLSGWEYQGMGDNGKPQWKSAAVEYTDFFVTPYAATNPYEDFAESLVAYRYNGEEFKKFFPSKYRFIQNNVFKGLEFTSQQSCKKAFTNP